MQVKGTGIKTTRDFVKEKFPKRFDEWIQSLPPESKSLYTGPLEIGKWYDIINSYYVPIEKAVELLYNRNAQKGGEEMGRYSAESTLKGVYKVFLLVATPQYLMKRATSMMQAFYNPSEIEVIELSKKQVVFKIKSFAGITKATEYRFAGWCARALELCNCKQVSYRITSHLALGQPFTAIEFSWE
jgi:hypothetical protein